uniref:Uncharacterized protein n=1 Tax=Arundo donax TaxID=35708 RepID=A0A0A9HN30_ARUDO
MRRTTRNLAQRRGQIPGTTTGVPHTRTKTKSPPPTTHPGRPPSAGGRGSHCSHRAIMHRRKNLAAQPSCTELVP